MKGIDAAQGVLRQLDGGNLAVTDGRGGGEGGAEIGVEFSFHSVQRAGKPARESAADTWATISWRRSGGRMAPASARNFAISSGQVSGFFGSPLGWRIISSRVRPSRRWMIAMAGHS